MNINNNDAQKAPWIEYSISASTISKPSRLQRRICVHKYFDKLNQVYCPYRTSRYHRYPLLPAFYITKLPILHEQRQDWIFSLTKWHAADRSVIQWKILTSFATLARVSKDSFVSVNVPCIVNWLTIYLGKS